MVSDKFKAIGILRIFTRGLFGTHMVFFWKKSVIFIACLLDLFYAWVVSLPWHPVLCLGNIFDKQQSPFCLYAQWKNRRHFSSLWLYLLPLSA